MVGVGNGKRIGSGIMQEVFEKIIERLEERLEEQHKLYAIAFLPEDRGGYNAYSDAIRIVKEVAEEYKEEK